MIQPRPNSASGWAHSAGESAHPGLWHSYLGGLAPFTISRECRTPAINKYHPTRIGTTFDIVGGPLGRAIAFNGNSAQEWAAGVANPFKVAVDATGSAPISIQAHFKYVHKTVATEMILFRSDNPTVVIAPHGYGLYVEANQDQIVFFTDRGNVADVPHGAIWPSAASSLTPGKWHHVVAVFWPYYVNDLEIAEYVLIWIDGKMIYPTPPATERNFVHHASLTSRCGAARFATAPDFTLDLLSVWNRPLSWKEADQLYIDPLSMFRRRRVVGAKGSRLVSLGGTGLRRLNIAVAG